MMTLLESVISFVMQQEGDESLEVLIETYILTRPSRPAGWPCGQRAFVLRIDIFKCPAI